MTVDGKHLFRALARARPSRGTVAILNPIGEEAKSAFSVLMHLSAALWEAGWSVLRFDTTGMGDSEGDFSQTVPDGWLSDCRAMLSETIQATDERPLVCLGLRFGANLAVRLTSDFQTDGLVLWEPILDTARYLRQLRSAGREMSDGLDHRGWLLSNDCLAQIEHGPPPVLDGSVPALAINISTARKLSAPFARFEDDDGRHQVAHVHSRPFWEMIGQEDCPDLIALTREWLERFPIPEERTR